jgi:hypothetical protein
LKPFKSILFFVLVLFTSEGFGQIFYSGTVINSTNGQAMGNCIVQTLDKSVTVACDSSGKFSLEVQTSGELPILISSLNCRIEARLLEPSVHFPSIYIYCAAVNLPPIEIYYQDAYTIVQTAFSRIPYLYMDSSYVAYGFYRNYKKINNLFKELTECKIGIAMRMDTANKLLTCDEAFGIRQIRRTLYTIPIDGFYDYQLSDFFKQNLIYHSRFAPFGPSLFPYGEFAIDEASTDSTWVISYRLQRLTGENHGVDNYDPRAFPGEGIETGFITINKSDYAITKLIRESVRNPKFQYPDHNNFLLPELLYTGWFEEGFLELNYEKIGSNYFLKNIYHAYKNSFVHVPTNTPDYMITDYSEWQCDSIGFTIDNVLLHQMEAYTKNEILPYTYDATAWKNTSPWYFVKKETVIAELEKRGPLLDLFTAGGK